MELVGKLPVVLVQVKALAQNALVLKAFFIAISDWWKQQEDRTNGFAKVVTAEVIKQF